MRSETRYMYTESKIDNIENGCIFLWPNFILPFCIGEKILKVVVFPSVPTETYPGYFPGDYPYLIVCKLYTTFDKISGVRVQVSHNTYPEHVWLSYPAPGTAASSVRLPYPYQTLAQYPRYGYTVVIIPMIPVWIRVFSPEIPGSFCIMTSGLVTHTQHKTKFTHY